MRTTFRSIVTICAVLLTITCARAAAAQPLRVCADPAYLPFSNNAGKGFENKVASAVAKDLGRNLEFTWASTRGPGGFDGFVHDTLAQNKCDVIVDVPYGDESVNTTRPYYISSYVFVYKSSKHYDINSMDSPQLRHVRVGYEADTPAEMGLKLRALTPGAKPFTVSDDEGTSPALLINAVETGKIDVGITWDPAIAYYAKSHPDLQVVRVPNTRSQGSPEQYTFPMAMATRPGDTALHDALDRVIATHQAQFDAILHDYGVLFFHAGSLNE